MAAASALSPIYPLYRERCDSSVSMVTVVFTAYGAASVRLGRRPALLSALLMAAASTAIFWTADNVLPLVIARAVQGVATGTAISALAPGSSASPRQDTRRQGPR
jgi:MFS family permease